MSLPMISAFASDDQYKRTSGNMHNIKGASY